MPDSPLLALSARRLPGRAEYGSVADHPERSPFTQVEMRGMWTYSDGALTVKGYWRPGGTAGAGSWVLVDQATGNVQGVVAAGEFSRRFRPVDVFADVPGLPDYLGTVTAPDGTALVDLILDRNPFMLANGPAGGTAPRAHDVPQPPRRMVLGHGFGTGGLPDGDDPGRRVVPQPGRRARGVLRQ